MGLREEIASMMARVRNGRLPASEMIVEVAFKELGYGPEGPDNESIRKEFNSRLKQVFEYTLEVLERFEENAYVEGVPDELIKSRPDILDEAAEIIRGSQDINIGIRRAFKYMFRELYPMLRRIFLSISQSRKTRGGRDFELQFGKLLEMAGVTYQKVGRQTRTDFMIPSDDMFNLNPNAALVLSAKRTLRERWREVAEELFNLRSPNVYLITADNRVSSGHAEQICRRYRIHLVVWDDLKNSRFANEPLVIGYSQLAQDVIPSFEERWKNL
jgi:hypothetical protein